METQHELTLRALVLGGILAVLLGAANAYLGLFAGMTVSACIPSAVISMGVLRLLGHGGILENTMVMTQASAGEALAAAAIFTLPALVILGVWDSFPYLWVTAIVAVGGFLGVLLTIPLRRALIVEQKLRFPEGTAVAEVLRVGERAGEGLKALGIAGLVGAVVKFGETGLKLWPGTAQVAGFVGNGIAYFGTNLSPALLGIGYIVGLNIAALVFMGSVISWNIAIPIYATWFMPTDPAFADSLAAGTGAADLAYEIWTRKIRYLGVGAMLVGGLWTLVSIRHSLFSGVKSGLAQFQRSRTEVVAATERDLPMPWVLAGIVACVVPIFFLYQQIVGSYGIAMAMAVMMLVAGFLFSSVAAYMAGLVGSSNNPISGVTMATMLLASLLLLALLGVDAARTCGRHHDRCGGLLRRFAGRRPAAGPEDRPAGGRHALETADGTGRGRAGLGVRDGTDPEPFIKSLWHRRTHGRAPQSAGRAPGHPHGLSGPGRVPRWPALGHGQCRRGDRRGNHRH